MQSTKEATPVLQPFGPLILELLVTEDNQPSLGNKESKLLLLPVVQLVELDAFDLRADFRGELWVSRVNQMNAPLQPW
jgi:hypothetical protein